MLVRTTVADAATTAATSVASAACGTVKSRHVANSVKAVALSPTSSAGPVGDGEEPRNNIIFTDKLMKYGNNHLCHRRGTSLPGGI